MGDDSAFAGAKVALFLGADLLVIRRDAHKPIPWPGYLDFPGGGREAGETPEDCVLRETREEVGLDLAAAELSWRRRYVDRAGPVWFFACRLPAERRGQVVFGEEGQGWGLMRPEAYLGHPDAIPHFADRLRDYLASAGA
ncbi:NUDIX domain-containing protein [Pseudooceanicola sp. 216_PA32_1]|uniref:8-oxo-dGTP diphosphatase n=1 Tax=Pseudooceanicola pacificus TaxID=2676438 RepID=A0A844WFJ2_9RHOB|nr:NUDIX hydrolase [Pseudooceanicola pacificus]MWB79200.1 NUDIX domain-containing protein [Pseudooceanicola pacificus]